MIKKSKIVFGLNRLHITYGVAAYKKPNIKGFGSIQIRVLNRKVNPEKDLQPNNDIQNDVIGATEIAFPDIASVDALIDTLQSLRKEMVELKVNSLAAFKKHEQKLIPVCNHHSKMVLLGLVEKNIIASFLTAKTEDIKTKVDLVVITGVLKNMGFLSSKEFQSIILIEENPKEVKKSVATIIEVIENNFDEFQLALMINEYQNGFYELPKKSHE